MLRKASAVDMIAASTAASTTPPRIAGRKASTKTGAASSGLARGASRPAATSAGTARPMPSQISTQTAWPPPITAGIHLSEATSRSM